MLTDPKPSGNRLVCTVDTKIVPNPDKLHSCFVEVNIQVTPVADELKE